jgi:hypothetical protein
MVIAFAFYLVLLLVGAIVDYRDYYDREGTDKPRKFISIQSPGKLLIRIFLRWPIKAIGALLVSS